MTMRKRSLVEMNVVRKIRNSAEEKKEREKVRSMDTSKLPAFLCLTHQGHSLHACSHCVGRKKKILFILKKFL